MVAIRGMHAVGCIRRGRSVEDADGLDKSEEGYADAWHGTAEIGLVMR
jgi:hypothetical protein